VEEDEEGEEGKKKKKNNCAHARSVEHRAVLTHNNTLFPYATFPGVPNLAIV